MEIIDTQILSFGFKEKIKLENKAYAVSSVTASEFLLIYSSNPLSANYYIPHPKFYQFPAVTMAKPSPESSKNNTEIYIIEFNGQFPTIIEYGSKSLSFLINKRFFRLYSGIIQFMPKTKRKSLRKRMQYIIEKEIICIPLNSKIIDISFKILAFFVNKYNSKENFRNTYNDILILSTAIETNSKLITNDNLLNKLSVEIYGGIIEKIDDDLVQVDFSGNSSVAKKDSQESKGYINRGWQYKERKSI